jgi:two-component system LytT family response regulator
MDRGEFAGVFADSAEGWDRILEEHAEIIVLETSDPDLESLASFRRENHQELPFVIVIVPDYRATLKAFELRAFDVLVEPVGEALLASTLRKVESAVLQRRDAPRDPRQSSMDAAQFSTRGYLTRMLVKANGVLLLINVSDIRWAQAEGPYVCLHTNNGTHLVRMPIGGLEKSLSPETFIRIHRSSIVNLGRVRHIQPTTNGDCTVALDDGTLLSMSRSFRARVLQRFTSE